MSSPNVYRLILSSLLEHEHHEAQARAMFDKIELGDDLLKIYADDVFAQSIIDAYPNIEQATK
jgi:hypothetical protein